MEIPVLLKTDIRSMVQRVGSTATLLRGQTFKTTVLTSNGGTTFLAYEAPVI